MEAVRKLRTPHARGSTGNALPPIPYGPGPYARPFVHACSRGNTAVIPAEDSAQCARIECFCLTFVRSEFTYPLL